MSESQLNDFCRENNVESVTGVIRSFDINRELPDQTILQNFQIGDTKIPYLRVPHQMLEHFHSDDVVTLYFVKFVETHAAIGLADASGLNTYGNPFQAKHSNNARLWGAIYASLIFLYMALSIANQGVGNGRLALLSLVSVPAPFLAIFGFCFLIFPTVKTGRLLTVYRGFEAACMGAHDEYAKSRLNIELGLRAAAFLLAGAAVFMPLLSSTKREVFDLLDKDTIYHLPHLSGFVGFVFFAMIGAALALCFLKPNLRHARAMLDRVVAVLSVWFLLQSFMFWKVVWSDHLFETRHVHWEAGMYALPILANICFWLVFWKKLPLLGKAKDAFKTAKAATA